MGVKYSGYFKLNSMAEVVLSPVKCLKASDNTNADFHLLDGLDKISDPQMVPPNVTVSPLMSKPDVCAMGSHIWSLSVSAGSAGCGAVAGKMIYTCRPKDLRTHLEDAFHLVYMPSTND